MIRPCAQSNSAALCRDGSSLRAHVDACAAEVGVDLKGGRVLLLSYPRLLGYAFNPLTLYFCYRADGVVGAVIYAVRNTFGERHAYLIAVDPADAARGAISQSCAKAFYVSPFIPMEAGYRFRLKPPGEQFSLAIQEDRKSVV